MSALTSAEIGAVVAEYDTGPLTRPMLARYAEASGDLNPLHLDPAFAQKAGFPDVIAHGMLGMALLGRLVTDAFGAQRLLDFNARFLGVVPVDSTLRCRARLESRDAAQAVLALEAVNEAGATVIAGSARLALAA